MKNTLKFGGTSVGSAENMRRVAEIIIQESAQLTVLSAMSGTTDLLLQFAKSADKETKKICLETINKKYVTCITELLSEPSAALAKLAATLEMIAVLESEKKIVAQGELLTSFIFTTYLCESGYKCQLLNAPDFMVINEQGLVDKKIMKKALAHLDPDTYYITQGFICSNDLGRIDNLGRGGSDYSAALMGVTIGSKEVQIWTDIDGMHNNDPRYVENTYPIRQMSFDEAAELAYFGAKILHPATIQPCKEAGINVRLKNTMVPEAPGTLITEKADSPQNFHAVAAKDNITLIRITSARMLMAYGFMTRIFEVFERWTTPIDMVTTSEVAVSLTIDNDTHLKEIFHELSTLGTIEVEQENSIVCIVGRIEYNDSGLAAKILTSIGSIPVKMISYGASHRSLSILIDTKKKKETLQSLNDHLFTTK